MSNLSFLIRPCFLLACICCTTIAQESSTKFAVASVKRAEHCTLENTVNPGRVALLGNPLKLVLVQAFRVKPDQLIGPSWLDSECFDIVATIPEGVGVDQLPAMLQSLLVERFKMTTHGENRQESGYALAVEKGGIKFKQTDSGLVAARRQSGRIAFGAARDSAAIKGSMTMASLSRFLSLRLGRPVQDATGLQGAYDIDVSWTPDSTTEKLGAFSSASPQSPNPSVAPEAPGGIDLFNALKQTLGLKLEARKQDVEIVVIDSINRVPVEN